ncbi:DUF2061 domain-containing protein [Luminiphilus sp.]|jgi:uncharacterized membrane protein|nr:DUF2061 domain-containing protein [Luminiphilus sp.]
MSLVTDLKNPDSRVRALAKALTWRITATLTTACIAFVVTGEIGVAMMIGGTEFVIKFFIYYGHERAWNLVR